MRPPLKWPGGKHRVLSHLIPRLRGGQRLVEPFAGSGVVTLNAGFEEGWLNDANPDLITFYECLRDQPDDMVTLARTWFRPAMNDPEAFAVARRQFNRTRSPLEKAALLLYLNKHSFNGLVRYNRSGFFNAPFGRYEAPAFPEKALWAMHAGLQRVRLTAWSFEAVLAEAREGDVLYCDPPYDPLTPTSSFSDYATEGFGPEEQQRLAVGAVERARQGNRVLISNHDTPRTRQWYSPARKYTFRVSRSISCKGERRGKAAEVLALFTPGIVRAHDRAREGGEREAG